MSPTTARILHPPRSMAPPLAVTFIAGPSGDWRIERLVAVAGDPLPAATHLSAGNEAPYTAKISWQLRGTVSSIRYTTAHELTRLNIVSPLLRCSEAMCAALIPIRKSDAWWSMAQDERRAIFEKSTATSPSRCPTCRRLRAACTMRATSASHSTSLPGSSTHRACACHRGISSELRVSEEWRHVERGRYQVASRRRLRQRSSLTCRHCAAPATQRR